MAKKKSAAKKKQQQQQAKAAADGVNGMDAVNGYVLVFPSLLLHLSSCLISYRGRHDEDTMSGDAQSPVVENPPLSESEPVETDPIKRAEQVKEEGNIAFKASRFQDAIESYTRAIGAYTPSVPARDPNRDCISRRAEHLIHVQNSILRNPLT